MIVIADDYPAWPHLWRWWCEPCDQSGPCGYSTEAAANQAAIYHEHGRAHLAVLADQRAEAGWTTTIPAAFWPQPACPTRTTNPIRPDRSDQ